MVADLPSRLLRRSPLLPGESLSSLLARLAKLNHYDPPNIINRLCLMGLERDRLDRPMKLATYERIATLTDIEPAQLYGATAHRFAQILTPPTQDIETIELTVGERVPLTVSKAAIRKLRPERAVQFCPQCLREASYHRLIWTPVAVAACLRHMCLLVNRCPQCHQPISVQAVVDATCTHCKASLVATWSLDISDDALGMHSQRAIQSCLADASEGFVCPPQSPRATYCVLDGLRHAVMSAGCDWEYLHYPDGKPPAWGRCETKHSSYQSYCIHTTAFRGLVDWPRSFYEFLRAYVSLREEKCRHGSCNVLGVFYATLLRDRWQHPTLAFAQDAFEQYALDNYARYPQALINWGLASDDAFAQRLPYVSFREAMRVLNVSSSTIWRLIETGHLLRYCPDKPVLDMRSAWEHLVLRSSLLRTQRELSKTMSLLEAARFYDLEPEIVECMVQLRVLPAVCAPDTDGSDRWTFTRRAVWDCEGKACAYVGTTGYHIDPVGLNSLARSMVPGGAMRAAKAVKLMMERKVEGYVRKNYYPRVLCAVVFDRERLSGELRNLEDRIGGHVQSHPADTFEAW